jgi:hypothetical protein
MLEPFFKEPTNVEVVEKINIDIDQVIPMSTIVEKNF